MIRYCKKNNKKLIEKGILTDSKLIEIRTHFVQKNISENL